jgi:hypothetical protein
MFDQDQFNADLSTIYETANDLFLVDAKKTPTLFHYTTGNGALGILGSASFRATHIKFLNDSKEYHYARDQIANGIESSLRTWRGMPLDTGYTTLVREILHASASELQRSLRVDDAPPDIYVVCFCIEGDLVDQWKSYGAEGFGYSIGFRTEQLAKIANCRLVTINYGKTTLDKVINRCMEHSAQVIREYVRKDYIDALKDSFLTFLKDFVNAISPAFKHEGFRRENEVRLVISGNDPPKKRGFVLKGSIVTPFWDISLGDDFSPAIEKIIVGPGSYANVAEAGLLSYLSATSLPSVTVQRSTQPYRVFR